MVEQLLKKAAEAEAKAIECKRLGDWLAYNAMMVIAWSYYDDACEAE